LFNKQQNVACLAVKSLYKRLFDTSAKTMQNTLLEFGECPPGSFSAPFWILKRKVKSCTDRQTHLELGAEEKIVIVIYLCKFRDLVSGFGFMCFKMQLNFCYITNERGTVCACLPDK
jgi:hypothetical protein